MKTGDVVVLKSGGPKMTISEASSGSTMAVIWWDPEAKKYMDGSYHKDMLMLLQANEIVEYISKKETCSLCGFSFSTLERILNETHPSYDPTFPKPRQSFAGSRRLKWRRTEVVEWCNNRKTNLT